MTWPRFSLFFVDCFHLGFDLQLTPCGCKSLRIVLWRICLQWHFGRCVNDDWPEK